MAQRTNTIGGTYIFPTSPNDFSMTLRWNTAVARCLTGEYRRALTDEQPAALIETSGITSDPYYLYAIRRIFQTVSREQEIYFPFWADAGERDTSTSATCSTTNSKWKVGEHALLWGDGSEWHIVEIQTVGVGGVTFDSGASFEWTHAAPLILGQMVNFEVDPNKGLKSWRATFRELISQENWITPDNAKILKLPIQPGGSSGVDNSVTDLMSSGLVTSAERFRNAAPYKIEYGFDSETRLGYETVLSTLAYFRGRFRSATMPSYLCDVKPIQDYSAGVSEIRLEEYGIDPLDFFPAKFWFTSSNFYTETNFFEVVNSYLDAGNLVLVLRDPLPADLKYTDRVSREYDLRFDADSFTFDFRRFGSFHLTTPMVEVV